MKKMTVIAASIAATFAFSGQALAGGDSPYVFNSNGEPVKTGHGPCLYNNHGELNSETAIEECNPELIEKEAKPAPKPVVEPPPAPEMKTVTLEADTFFDFDKSFLRPEGKGALDALVRDMGDLNSVAEVSVVGHTDYIGTDEYNQGLSERRAASVKEYLIEQGIPANRIEAIGRGETEADGKTSAERQDDRRVDVTIKGTDQ
ncbi:MAG: OmpA family protein [Halothiobacillaceae bacterium]|nr:OmpA family protein [Halothiobacillaceae bacterium]HER34243.1 OmpA family protein [Halothiobacillaceae bacterium]